MDKLSDIYTRIADGSSKYDRALVHRCDMSQKKVEVGGDRVRRRTFGNIVVREIRETGATPPSGSDTFLSKLMRPHFGPGSSATSCRMGSKSLFYYYRSYCTIYIVSRWAISSAHFRRLGPETLYSEPVRHEYDKIFPCDVRTIIKFLS